MIGILDHMDHSALEEVYTREGMGTGDGAGLTMLLQSPRFSLKGKLERKIKSRQNCRSLRDAD